MIHSWRLVILGWQNQFPLAKFFLGVGVGEFVPAIYGGTQSGFKYIKLIGKTTQISVLISRFLIT